MQFGMNQTDLRTAVHTRDAMPDMEMKQEVPASPSPLSDVGRATWATAGPNSKVKR